MGIRCILGSVLRQAVPIGPDWTGSIQIGSSLARKGGTPQTLKILEICLFFKGIGIETDF
jgi:hypothetical protein